MFSVVVMYVNLILHSLLI